MHAIEILCEFFPELCLIRSDGGNMGLYQNGVLEITAPITAAALPRRIEIKGLSKAKRAGA